MRVPPEHKEQGRKQLVLAGAALAKKRGFAATGLDALMSAAGVTTGAFYTRFKSKPEFLRAIVEQELSRVVQRFAGKSMPELHKALAAYLSPAHASQPELGCAIPALGAEIARADVATRKVFETQVQRVHETFAETLGDRDAAWAVICQSVGAVLIARAMATGRGRDEVLASVLRHARKTLSDE